MSKALARRSPAQIGSAALLCAIAFVWTTPFLWMVVAAFRPESGGSRDMASLLPPHRPPVGVRQAASIPTDTEACDRLMLVRRTFTVTGPLARAASAATRAARRGAPAPVSSATSDPQMPDSNGATRCGCPPPFFEPPDTKERPSSSSTSTCGANSR